MSVSLKEPLGADKGSHRAVPSSGLPDFQGVLEAGRRGRRSWLPQLLRNHIWAQIPLPAEGGQRWVAGGFSVRQSVEAEEALVQGTAQLRVRSRGQRWQGWCHCPVGSRGEVHVPLPCSADLGAGMQTPLSPRSTTGAPR